MSCVKNRATPAFGSPSSPACSVADVPINRAPGHRGCSAQGLAEPPQEAGHVGPQHAVVGVDFIQHDEPHLVPGENLPPVAPHEHVFQHHVVGQQQVGRGLAELQAGTPLVRRRVGGRDPHIFVSRV